MHCIFSTSRLQINWTTRSQEEWPRAPSIFSEYCETGELQLNIESMDQEHWNSYGLVYLPRGQVIFSNHFPGVEIKSTFFYPFKDQLSVLGLSASNQVNLQSHYSWLTVPLPGLVPVHTNTLLMDANELSLKRRAQWKANKKVNWTVEKLLKIHNNSNRIFKAEKTRHDFTNSYCSWRYAANPRAGNNT